MDDREEFWEKRKIDDPQYARDRDAANRASQGWTPGEPRGPSDKHRHEWSEGDDRDWPRTTWARICFAAGVLAYIGYMLVAGFVWLVNQMHPVAAFIAATVIVFTLAMTLPFNAFCFVTAAVLTVALWLYWGK